MELYFKCLTKWNQILTVETVCAQLIMVSLSRSLSIMEEKKTFFRLNRVKLRAINLIVDIDLNKNWMCYLDGTNKLSYMDPDVFSLCINKIAW